MKRIYVQTMLILITVATLGCGSDARVASQNLSKAADMFEIERRIVFYNGITGDYILSIEGRCAIEKDKTDAQLEVTCKTGPNDYKKHFLGVSDNVTYFAEQLDGHAASVFQYRVIFKPSAIVPNVDLEVGLAR